MSESSQYKTIPPLIVVVTRMPAMFDDDLPAQTFLKNLIEHEAKEITGMDFGYFLETEESDGGFPTPAVLRCSLVQPAFTFPEQKDSAVWKFFRGWLKGMMHSDTHLSRTDIMRPPRHHLSHFTMDVMCIQPDETYLPNNIIDAWYVRNMYPTETGFNGFATLENRTEFPDRTIPFNGVVEHSSQTKYDGAKLASTLDIMKPRNLDLEKALGGVYMCNFFGVDGAAKFLKSVYTNPEGCPDSESTHVTANPSLYFNTNSQPRTYKEIYDLMIAHAVGDKK